MFLSPQQIHELLSIVDRYTLLFVAHNVGTSVLSEQDKATLRLHGIDFSSIDSSSSKVYEAYKFGMLSKVLNESVLKGMNYQQLKSSITKMSPLSTLQKNALESLKLQTYQDVSKLNSRMKSDVVDTFVKADKKRHTIHHTKLVTDAAKEAIEKRKWTNEIVSILGEKTGEWDRDLGRIADYVLHTAFDEGRSAQMQKEGGDKSLVYKDVYPGACKHCQDLYLTAGIGSEPQIFKLDALKANGTNIGRKVAEWLPVVGPIHPFCRCTLESVPKGFTVEDKNKGIWYWDGRMWQMDYDRTKELQPRKVERKSKIKVTVGDKVHER